MLNLWRQLQAAFRALKMIVLESLYIILGGCYGPPNYYGRRYEEER